MPDPRRIVLGVTGASGAVYGVRALELLRAADDVEVHLVVSRGSRATLRQEMDLSTRALSALADVTHSNEDLGASIASGSFPTAGMLVAPCSVKTLSAVANSFSDTLIARAADVTLKERRPLLLAVRETPFHTGHLRLMTAASEAGATIFPPVPAFYARPGTVEELVDHSVARMLEHVGVRVPSLRRWEGLAQDAAGRPEDGVARLPRG